MPKDYPQGEQFYTDALSGLALSAVFASQHGERKMAHVSARSTTFSPETLHILGSALDDAWQRLEVRVHLNGSGDVIRTVLAKHIIAMAEQGELDRQRLIERALARLKL
jgi:hypothetical protein